VRDVPAGALRRPPHPLLADAFAALTSADVAWLVLRAEDRLAEPGEDVDLLISPGDSERAADLLVRLGFVHVPTGGRGTHAFYEGYHAQSDRWIKLDVVSELAFGPYLALRTGLAEGCLARRSLANGVASLSPDDAFWTLLLHFLVDKGNVDPDRARRLAELSAGARVDTVMAKTVARIAPPEWTPTRLIETVETGDPQGLEAAGRAIAARWGRSNPIRIAARNAMGRLGRATERPRQLLYRPGFSVALLGPDGTGKSTIAAGVARSFPFPARVVYMGLWQKSTRLPLRGIPGSDLLVRLLITWRRYLLSRAHRARRRLVIFDRYPYDALLGLQQSPSRRERLYLSALGRSLPSPDLVLVLDTPGAVAYARKGEHDASHLEADRRGFLALRGRLPRVEIVDANRPLEAVQRDVMARIWDAYRRRWRT
jgi:thymidylate kinase